MKELRSRQSRRHQSLIIFRVADLNEAREVEETGKFIFILFFSPKLTVELVP